MVRAIEVGDFDLYRCAHCASWCSDALHRNAPTAFEHSRYHENDAADDRKRLDLLQRVERRGPIRSVLDVGCGTGAFLSVVGERRPGARRMGIELDLERARQARETNPGAEIQSGDAAEILAGIEETYDLITLWDVYEHLPSPAPLLRDLAGKLSPRGCIYIQTVNEHSIAPLLGRLSYRLTGGRMRKLVRRTHDPGHLVFFSRKGLSILAEQAGLSVEELWFDRLARARMDGNPLVIAATSMLLFLENIAGNGLFVNLILEPARG